MKNDIRNYNNSSDGSGALWLIALLAAALVAMSCWDAKDKIETPPPSPIEAKP